jgi:hypothetical protein
MTAIRNVIAAFLAGLILTPAAPAFADICTSLEAQLASLERQGAGPRGGNDFAKYSAAAAKQQSELARATEQARQAGCTGGFLIFQPRRSPQCPSLMAQINRMRVNLAKLTAARDRAGAGGDDFGYGASQRRGELLRALAYNQCGPQYGGGNRRFADDPYENAPRGQGSGLFGMLFGQQRRGNPDYFPSEEPQVGTYRTLCVRTCDGYYFPISFSTVRSKFAQDEQVCQAMCPSAEVTLYVHRNPGEDSEQMVSSSTGEPYTALPAAFKYRKEYTPACSCRAAGAFAALQPAEPSGSLQATLIDPNGVQTLVPVPEPRPGPGEDPETTANRAGGFTPAPPPPPPEAPMADLGDRHIRVVGPEFYVAQ